jgi:UDP-N-acetylglucosamine acyltransferase
MNQIHPTAHIAPGVQIGRDNVIGPYAVITGNTTIGNRNWIGPHVVIGTPPQHRSFDHFAPSNSNNGQIEIGDENISREFVTIQSPTHELTHVGNNGFFMTQVHIPHDAFIEDLVTIANSSHLAGHVRICKGANLGLGVVVHQYLVVGAMAMIGMGSVVTKNVKPFSLAFGHPCKDQGINTIGISRTAIQLGFDLPVEKIEDWNEEIIRVHFHTEFERYEKLVSKR